MNNKSVSQQAHLAIRNWVLIPTLMDGSESWVWQKKNENRINAFEHSDLEAFTQAQYALEAANDGLYRLYDCANDRELKTSSVAQNERFNLTVKPFNG
ncbi:hypothetical protein EVAR_95602_1 [Eumeta japonica]|uniref:Uncharacterized protein n=1 Tax=Eumeta variegata TaxID=151549 RepID=A0A4C1VKP9_EUMVA|nr:hypothetical protein EVAR_95602_1 [Eumeta japonica]